MPHQEIVNEIFKTNYKFEDGFMTIDDSPGTGVDIDEKKLRSSLMLQRVSR